MNASFEMSSSIRSRFYFKADARALERSGEMPGSCGVAGTRDRSAPALQEPACHGDGDEHVERAGLRQNAGARGSGGGGGVRVGRQGVVPVHRLVSRQHGGVDRGDRALR